MNLLFERVEKLLRDAVNDGHVLIGYRCIHPENITLFRLDSTGGFFRLYDLEEYWFSFSNACEFKIGIDGSIFLKDIHGDAVILNFFQKTTYLQQRLLDEFTF